MSQVKMNSPLTKLLARRRHQHLSWQQEVPSSPRTPPSRQPPTIPANHVVLSPSPTTQSRESASLVNLLQDGFAERTMSLRTHLMNELRCELGVLKGDRTSPLSNRKRVVEEEQREEQQEQEQNHEQEDLFQISPRRRLVLQEDHANNPRSTVIGGDGKPQTAATAHRTTPTRAYHDRDHDTEQLTEEVHVLQLERDQCHIQVELETKRADEAEIQARALKEQVKQMHDTIAHMRLAAVDMDTHHRAETRVKHDKHVQMIRQQSNTARLKLEKEHAKLIASYQKKEQNYKNSASNSTNSLNKRITSYQNEIKQLEKQRNALKTNVATLSKESSDFKTAANESMTTLKKTNKALNKRITSCQNELTQVEKQRDAFRVNAATLAMERNELKTVASEVKIYTQHLEKREKQLETECTNKIQTLQSKVRNLEEKEAAGILLHQVNQLNEQQCNKELVLQNEKQKNEIATLTVTLHNYETLMKEHQNTIHKQEEEYYSGSKISSEEIHVLKTKNLKTLKELAMVTKQLNDRPNSMASQQSQEHQQEMTRMQQLLAVSNAHLESSDSELIKMDEENTVLLDKHQHAIEELRNQLENEVQSKEYMKKENVALQETMNTLMSSLSDATNEAEAHQDHLNRLRTELSLCSETYAGNDSNDGNDGNDGQGQNINGKTYDGSDNDGSNNQDLVVQLRSLVYIMSTKMTNGNQQNLLTMKTNLKQSYEKKMSLFKEKVQQKIQETLSNSKTTHATTMNAMTEKVQQQSQELKELKMELHLASELEMELSAQMDEKEQELNEATVVIEKYANMSEQYHKWEKQHVVGSMLTDVVSASVNTAENNSSVGSLTTVLHNVQHENLMLKQQLKDNASNSALLDEKRTVLIDEMKATTNASNAKCEAATNALANNEKTYKEQMMSFKKEHLSQINLNRIEFDQQINTLLQKNKDLNQQVVEWKERCGGMEQTTMEHDDRFAALLEQLTKERKIVEFIEHEKATAVEEKEHISGLLEKLEVQMEERELKFIKEKEQMVPRKEIQTIANVAKERNTKVVNELNNKIDTKRKECTELQKEILNLKKNCTTLQTTSEKTRIEWEEKYEQLVIKCKTDQIKKDANLQELDNAMKQQMKLQKNQHVVDIKERKMLRKMLVSKYQNTVDDLKQRNIELEENVANLSNNISALKQSKGEMNANYQQTIAKLKQVGTALLQCKEQQEQQKKEHSIELEAQQKQLKAQEKQLKLQQASFKQQENQHVQQVQQREEAHKKQLDLFEASFNKQQEEAHAVLVQNVKEKYQQSVDSLTEQCNTLTEQCNALQTEKNVLNQLNEQQKETIEQQNNQVNEHRALVEKNEKMILQKEQVLLSRGKAKENQTEQLHKQTMVGLQEEHQTLIEQCQLNLNAATRQHEAYAREKEHREIEMEQQISSLMEEKQTFMVKMKKATEQGNQIKQAFDKHVEETTQLKLTSKQALEQVSEDMKRRHQTEMEQMGVEMENMALNYKRKTKERELEQEEERKNYEQIQQLSQEQQTMLEHKQLKLIETDQKMNLAVSKYHEAVVELEKANFKHEQLIQDLQETNIKEQNDRINALMKEQTQEQTKHASLKNTCNQHKNTIKEQQEKHSSFKKAASIVQEQYAAEIKRLKEETIQTNKESTVLLGQHQQAIENKENSVALLQQELDNVKEKNLLVIQKYTAELKIVEDKVMEMNQNRKETMAQTMVEHQKQEERIAALTATTIALKQTASTAEKKVVGLNKQIELFTTERVKLMDNIQSNTKGVDDVVSALRKQHADVVESMQKELLDAKKKEEDKLEDMKLAYDIQHERVVGNFKKEQHVLEQKCSTVLENMKKQKQLHDQNRTNQETLHLKKVEDIYQQHEQVTQELDKHVAMLNTKHTNAEAQRKGELQKFKAVIEQDKQKNDAKLEKHQNVLLEIKAEQQTMLAMHKQEIIAVRKQVEEKMEEQVRQRVTVELKIHLQRIIEARTTASVPKKYRMLRISFMQWRHDAMKNKLSKQNKHGSPNRGLGGKSESFIREEVENGFILEQSHENELQLQLDKERTQQHKKLELRKAKMKKKRRESRVYNAEEDEEDLGNVDSVGEVDRTISPLSRLNEKAEDSPSPSLPGPPSTPPPPTGVAALQGIHVKAMSRATSSSPVVKSSSRSKKLKSVPRKDSGGGQPKSKPRQPQPKGHARTGSTPPPPPPEAMKGGTSPRNKSVKMKKRVIRGSVFEMEGVASLRAKFAQQEEESSRRKTWSNLSTSPKKRDESPPPPPCKAYQRGRCTAGDRCRFTHEK